MWRNYLTVGLRSLTKNRAYAVINILGLAIGMAACLLILLFVRYEFSYDKWIPDVANTYQLQAWYPNPKDQPPDYLLMSSYITGPALKKDFPQVEKTAYVLSSAPVIIKDGQASPSKNFLYTDTNLLDVIDLPLVRGSRQGLNGVDTAVLTQDEAIKRYGTEDVVGKTITVIAKGISHDYKVVGVLKNLPKNTHLRVSTIAHVDFQSFMAKEPQFLTCWSCQSGWVYVKLKPGADPAKFFDPAEPAWEKRNIPDQNTGEAHFNAGDEQDWHLINLRDIHLGKAQQGTMTPGNDRATIATFAVIALLILGMACVNFTNLATARASQRAREVALRKVLGANRSQLILQFIGESILVAFFAMMIALALVEVILPFFSHFLDADIRMQYFGAGGVLLPVIALVLVVGLAGGLYPAFFLSRFQPASVLKANKSAADTPGSGRLRNVLVVAQFAVSIGLIICTAVIYGQTVYARTVDPGYKRDHILQVDNMSRYQLIPLGQTIVDQTRRVKGVLAVGRTDIGVATTNNSNTGVMVPGTPKPITIGQYNIDGGFFDAMGIKLLAGRFYDVNRPMDDATLPFPEDKEAEKRLAARGLNVVINRFAAEKLGFRKPQDAIGKQIRIAFVSEEFGLVPANVIGVVENSRFRSVRDPIDPIIFFLSKSGSMTTMVVRYTGDPAAVRAGVERVWKSITHDVPFEAKFSEDIIQDLYKAEESRAQIFAAFALLAVVVGCLGLFGLATFTAERRTKEIGIRKVLGARTRDIVRLLVWQFTRPVIVANLIAWPVAWWMMRNWLNTFDDRIALGPTPFFAAGLLALLIAVGTIAGHAMRVASANPIRALRYE